MSDKAAVLAQLARAMAAHDDQQPLPFRLCRACAEILDADSGAITVAYTRPERVTLCATDEAASRLEDLQDVLGQGPGPDAYESGEVVVARLDGEDSADRWPMLSAAARAVLGYAASMYAFPIRPESDVLGVLTLYQIERRTLRYDLPGARFLADAIGAALLHDPESQTEMSSGPWTSRAQIHQATGIVVAQLRIAPDDALALLRAHAYAHDMTLDGIATEVVERRLDFRMDSSGNDDRGSEDET